MIARCLAKHPAERFGSTRDIVAALDGSAAGFASGTSLADAVTSATQSREPAVVPLTGTQPTPRLRRRAVSIAIGLVVLASVGLAAWYRFWAPAATIDSLAVLPFENRSVERGSEYLGDELTESLIDQMSRVPSLRVMARATVFRLRGSDPREAGRKLGVGAVLSGSVARRGNQLVISAELIDARTGAQLWGERYDRPFTDLIQVQDTIAAEIAEGLRLRLSGQEKRTLGAHGTDNPEAYELFLKARYLMISVREDDESRGQAAPPAGARKDPAFVDARLAFAATYARSAGEGFAPPKDVWPRSAEEARKVLAMAPGDVAARAALAAYRFLFEWDSGDRRARAPATEHRPAAVHGPPVPPHCRVLLGTRAARPGRGAHGPGLRLDPGNLESRVMLGDFLAHAGRLDDAVEYHRAIVEVAPADARPRFALADILRRPRRLRGRHRGPSEGVRALRTKRPARTPSSERGPTRTWTRPRSPLQGLRLRDLEELAKERYYLAAGFRTAARHGRRARPRRSFASSRQWPSGRRCSSRSRWTTPGIAFATTRDLPAVVTAGRDFVDGVCGRCFCANLPQPYCSWPE